MGRYGKVKTPYLVFFTKYSQGFLANIFYIS